MKYVVILGDGMADLPIEELGGKTPIEAAKTPTIDKISKKSELGLAATIPDGMKPGSDTANLAVLGYNPEVYYSGRSPLEALSIGVDMKDTDIALRVNFVTVTEDEPFEEKVIIDHSSGEISNEEAKELLEAIKKEMDCEEFKFYFGTSYRHCCIWDKGTVIDLAQPHDHLDEKIGQYIPGEKKFADMMRKSYEILNHHPINEERRKNGKNPANCLWFWGAGTRPSLTDFKEKTGKTGAMISAVDLLKGIAIGANMKVIIVEGANGQLDTNYEGKAQAALNALLKDNLDFVYVHVEAPDEMGHQGSIERKIKAIENLDSRLINIVYDGLKASDEDFRMLITPDHPTPIAVRTHTSTPVPYLMYDSTDEKEQEFDYSERNAEKTGIFIKPGYKLMARFLQEEE